jgi:hypothetical protein
MRGLLSIAIAATFVSTPLFAADSTHGFDGFGGVYKHWEPDTKKIFTLIIDGDKATLKGQGLTPEQSEGLTVEVSSDGRTAVLKDAGGKKVAGFSPEAGDYTYGSLANGGFAKGYGIWQGFWVKEVAVGSTESWSNQGVLKEGVYQPVGFNLQNTQMNIAYATPGKFTDGTFLRMSADRAKDDRMTFSFRRRVENNKLLLTQYSVDYSTTPLKEVKGVTVTFDMSDPMKLTCLDCDVVDTSFPSVWVFTQPADVAWK